MGSRVPDDVRHECRRLREVERLSLGEIALKLKLGPSTVQSIAGDIKLTEEEIRKKSGRKTPPEVRDECLRLRLEERLSIKEIAKKLPISVATVHSIVKEIPLTPEELKYKRESLPPRTSFRDQGVESPLYLKYGGACLSKLQKARVAEAATLMRLTLNDFAPYTAVFDGEKIDWIVSLPGSGQLVKLQVKWARETKAGKGKPFCVIRCSNGRGKSRDYVEGEFDFLVSYSLLLDRCFVWSWVEVKNKRCVAVSQEAEERWDKILTFGPAKNSSAH